MFMRSGYSAQTRSGPGAEWVGVSSGTEHHHRAAHVLLGGGHLASGERLKVGRHSLPLELPSAYAVELDDLAPRARRALRAPAVGDHPVLTLDENGALEHAHAGRTAHVEDSLDTDALRRGLAGSVGAVERLGGGDDRAGEQPAGSQVRAGSAQEGCSAAGAAE